MNILIVEDEISLAEALKQILKREGYFADCVYDGESALDWSEGFCYDLIILDVMLPKRNGFEVVNILRKKGLNIPILMLTARSTIPDIVNGLKSGADDYMTKPFDTEELLARVSALTRRTGDIAVDELSYADLTLDLHSAQLYCADDSVQLSHKEFKVAQMFISNPTMTITKEMLIINVWGINSEATDNNVEAYISFLRKKLRFLKSTVSIKNIQKIGYRLEVESQ